VAECFSAAVKYRRPPSEFLADSKVSTRARSGFPQKKAHAQDAPHLFLDHVHANTPFAPLTTFFVRRCVYYAYFGKRLLPELTARRSEHSVSLRDTSPLFVDKSDSPGLAPEIGSKEGPVPARSVHEDYHTRRVLEGHKSTPIEDNEEENHQVPLEYPNESVEDEDMADEGSEAAEDYPQNESTEALGGEDADVVSLRTLLDPLELRSPITSHSDSSDEHTTHSHSSKHLSTPEENASEHEDLEQEDQGPARDYSPSVYSVRRRSSVGEDRDSETRRRYEEDLIRAIQERERLDED
jgi:hypothetical protein